MKRIALISSCLLSLVAAAFAAPQLPRPQGWVTDLANVMTGEAKQNVTALAAELEQKTSAELAVVTLDTLNGDTLDDVAVRLFEAWKIGKKGKDNGVLLIAAIKDRQVRIEVGYGLEGILPDGKVGEILDTYVLPNFKQNDYSQGLTLGARAVASVIAKDAGVELTGEMLPVEPAGRSSPLNTVFGIIVFIVMLIVFIRHPFLFLLFMGMGRGGGRGGGFGSGGGFGGFGGGMSGGGGASRGW